MHTGSFTIDVMAQGGGGQGFYDDRIKPYNWKAWHQVSKQTKSKSINVYSKATIEKVGKINTLG